MRNLACNNLPGFARVTASTVHCQRPNFVAQAVSVHAGWSCNLSQHNIASNTQLGPQQLDWIRANLLC